jgi:hypothetical protein
MNSISNRLETNTAVIKNFMTTIANDFTTNYITYIAASFTISDGTANILASSGTTYIADGPGSNITLTQRINSIKTMEAVSHIVSDINVQNEFKTDLANKIINSIENNQDIENMLKANNVLSNLKEHSGELNNFINKAAEVIGDLTGAQKKDTVKQTISNRIEANIINSTLDKTQIETIIKNTVSANIKNVSENNCGINSSVYNTLGFNNDTLIARNAGSITITQDQIIQDFLSCIFSVQTSASIVSKMNSSQLIENMDQIISNITDTNKENLSNDMKNVEKETSFMNIIADAITKNIQMIIIALIVIGVGALIVFGIILLRKKGDTKMDSLIDTGLDKVMDIGVKKVDNTLSDMLDPLKDNPPNVATTLKYLLNL